MAEEEMEDPCSIDETNANNSKEANANNTEIIETTSNDASTPETSKKKSAWAAKFSSDSGQPNSNDCCVCNKRVYPMEKITADNKPYHKLCFKCAECKKCLSLGNYASLNGCLYCKPHFTQLFKLKGNYNDGFAPGASKTFQSKAQSGTNRT